MEYAVICIVALVVSGLTLFSGFGLGTLLLPAFALFFPINFAVAGTAVVHLANNLFKVLLVGKHADRSVVIRFALPAAASAAVGALVLGVISDMAPLARFSIGGRVLEITTLKVAVSVLIGAFAVWDLVPRFDKIAFDRKFIPVGGALSGFFGGLSGLQGALRSAFLIRAGLEKEAFVATGVVSTVIVDISRLFVYGATFVSKDFGLLAEHDGAGLIIAGILAAFLGSFIGVRLLKKTTMRTLQLIVGAMLLLLAIALGTGLI